MKRQQKSAAVLQKECDDFNAKCKVGAAVTLRKDGGEVIETVTTSEAYVMSGHTSVIFVKGVSGCYDLSRVTPMQGALQPG